MNSFRDLAVIYDRETMADENVPCLYSCCTDADITEYKTVWIIKRLSFCDVDSLKSLKFSDNSGKLIWHYRLYPRVYDEAGMHYVKLEFVIDACGDSPSRLILRVELLNAKREKKGHESRIDAVAGKCKTMLYCNRRDDHFFVGDDFTINFEVIVVEEIQCQEIRPKIILPASQLIPNFARLLEDQTFSDVTIAVGSREFLAHKAILAARSKVFAAMFTHDMLESKLDRVVIRDCEPAIFEELLRFIYTDSVRGDVDAMALDLLKVADKYDLEKLKALCERSLCAKITEQTVIGTLTTADLFRGQQLRRAAIGFIARNNAVMQTEEWKNLWILHFEVANEAVREILQLKRT